MQSGTTPTTAPTHALGAAPSGAALALLVALIAIGAFLRLDGMDKLQPHLQEADPHVVLQMQMHRKGRADRKKLPAAYYQYPTMMARGLALLPAATPPENDAASTLTDREWERRALAAASADIVRVRSAVAWFSIGLIPLTWMLARRLFRREGPALFAAAVVTFSVLHLLFSQQARMHGPQATFALATVLAAMRMRARPSLGSYAAGAVCFALAFGFLHNGAAAVLPLFVAHVLRDRSRKFPWLGGLPLLIPAAVVFALFYPSPPTLQGAGGPDEKLEFGGHTMPFDKLDGSGFVGMTRYLWDYEPALLVAAALGLLVGLAALVMRRPSPTSGSLAGSLAGSGWLAGARGSALIACSYALPYLAAIGLLGELTQDRFLIPLVPFLACLAAWPLELLGARRAPALALSAAALAFPVFVVGKYVQLRSAPDTVEQAAEWVRSNGEPGPGGTRVLASARLAMPLLHSPEALRIASEDYATRQTMWLGWQLDHLPHEDEAEFHGGPRWDLLLTPGKLLNMNKERGRADIEAWLDRADAEFAVLEVSKLMAFITGAALLRDVIAERGELVEVLRAEDPRWCTEPPFDYQEVPSFVPRILAASSFGPCIEIYRLKP